MKVQPTIPTAKSPQQPLRPTAPRPEAETDPPAESNGLSPERVNEGASITSHVLREILIREQHTYHERHWGINE
jgi:hypothetical protein